MTLKDAADRAAWTPIQDLGDLVAPIGGGYTGDLLSDVMGHAKEKSVWITCQIHENIVAVARLKNLAAIVLVNGRIPDPAVLKRAREERIPIYGTAAPAFEASGALHRILAEAKDR
jgi:hypothetical protein